MFKCLDSMPKLYGKTIIVVDVSGSMYGSKISTYSEMDRIHAACSLAMLLDKVCDQPIIYTTAGNDSRGIHATKKIAKNIHGFQLSNHIYTQKLPLGGGGIFLKQLMDYIKNEEGAKAERIIVFTDEQDCDKRVGGAPSTADLWAKKHYMVNVGSYQNGIGYGNWIHIDGFSEYIINYITMYEKMLMQFGGD